MINSSEFLKSKENKDDFVLFPLDNKLNNKTKQGKSYNSFDNSNYLTVKKIKELIKKTFLTLINKIYKMIPYGKQSIDKNDIDSVKKVLKEIFIT